jgi:hypothetical protein
VSLKLFKVCLGNVRSRINEVTIGPDILKSDYTGARVHVVLGFEIGSKRSIDDRSRAVSERTQRDGWDPGVNDRIKSGSAHSSQVLLCSIQGSDAGVESRELRLDRGDDPILFATRSEGNHNC